MSAVLANVRVRAYRSAERERRRNDVALARAVATERRADGDSVDTREDLCAAARRLPPRFALAIRLRLHGLAVGEVRAALAIELGVGAEMARKIDARALELLRTSLTRPAAGCA